MAAMPIGCVFVTSPRLRGEVGSSAIRVGERHSAFPDLLYALAAAPHPSPLPAITGRGGAVTARGIQ
jgi:hypothetical protein